MGIKILTQDQDLYKNLRDAAGGRDLYIIGGYVRDLLLGISTRDLDFMVDKDLKESLELIVEKFKKQFNNNITTSYSRFFTAKINFENPLFGHSILDFSQARKENYPTPASRPVVSEGTLNEDVLRRDFTINSMAILGDKLIDLSEGKKDLETKLIRVHHAKSFIDDPIRLVRAIRFSQRLNFDLEKNTVKYFEEARDKNFLSLVSPRRRYEELKKILTEGNRNEILERLKAEKLLNILCPAVVIRLPELTSELETEEMLLKIVEPDSSVWLEFVDSLGLPKSESQRLKRKCTTN